MHILLVCTARGIPLYGTSGASAHLRGVARALRRRGHALTLIVADMGDLAGHAPVDASVRSLPTPKWPRSRRRREHAESVHAQRLMRLAPPQVDLVWHRHALHDDAVGAWCRAHGRPRWLEVNAPLTLERALLDPLGRPRRAYRAEVRSLRTADRVLVVSRWLEPWARAHGATEVHWLPNGSALLPSPPRANAGAPVVGFLGSGRPWHRLDRLAPLLDALPEARAWVVGAKAPAHPQLRHVPFAPDPRTAVAQMDVGVVLGGLPWVCPLKVFDYRSQGVPVVAVPVGDTPHLAARMDGIDVVPWGEAWPEAVRAAARRPRTRSIRSWDDVVAEAFATG